MFKINVSPEQGPNDGGTRAAQFPGRRITVGDEKSPNYFTSTFFNTVRCFRMTSGSNIGAQN